MPTTVVVGDAAVNDTANALFAVTFPVIFMMQFWALVIAVDEELVPPVQSPVKLSVPKFVINIPCAFVLASPMTLPVKLIVDVPLNNIPCPLLRLAALTLDIILVTPEFAVTFIAPLFIVPPTNPNPVHVMVYPPVLTVNVPPAVPPLLKVVLIDKTVTFWSITTALPSA